MSKLTAYLVGGNPVGTVEKGWSDSDLSGNAAFLIEDTVSTGYQDVSSIENWDEFGLIVTDYKRVCDEIESIVLSTGFTNLSTTEKTIALKHFVAGAGNDYTDPIFTATQYAGLHALHLEAMSKALQRRALFAQEKLKAKVYQASLTNADAGEVVVKSFIPRAKFILDGILGTNDGNITAGIIDWLENTDQYLGEAISAADSTAKTFVIDIPYSSSKYPFETIYVRGSSGNDGYYTVTDISKQGGSGTKFTVSEALGNSVADGTLYYNGFKSCNGYTDALRDEALDVYRNG